MKPTDLKYGFMSVITAFSATLCCVLPMTIVFLGMGSGAFMMTTMKFRIILYPLGLLGVGVSYYLYFKKKKECDALSCRMQGKAINLTLIVFSTIMMGIVTYVDFFLTSA